MLTHGSWDVILLMVLVVASTAALLIPRPKTDQPWYARRAWLLWLSIGLYAGRWIVEAPDWPGCWFLRCWRFWRFWIAVAIGVSLGRHRTQVLEPFDSRSGARHLYDAHLQIKSASAHRGIGGHTQLHAEYGDLGRKISGKPCDR